MDNFFKNVAFENAQNIEQASRLIFELRENRNALLMPYSVADDSELLTMIVNGTVAEHPAYEHYLSARILANTRKSLREELASHLAETNGVHAKLDDGREPDESCHHIDLKAQLEARYADRLDGEPQLMQDAVSLCFDTGLVLEFRVASADAYSFHWLWGEAELIIDTAPVHKGSADTFPNHFHDDDETCKADPITEPGRAPFENICALIDALLIDPLLGKSVD